MRSTYEVTVRVTVDLAAYAAEYDMEGSPVDELTAMVRSDLAQVSVVPDALSEVYSQPGAALVTWVSST